jgi:hypothetical protein
MLAENTLIKLTVLCKTHSCYKTIFKITALCKTNKDYKYTFNIKHFQYYAKRMVVTNTIFKNFQYYAKRITKEFRGTDTTKLAIESSKKSKGGRSRFLVLSEKDVKILKRDAKVCYYLYYYYRIKG